MAYQESEPTRNPQPVKRLSRRRLLQSVGAGAGLTIVWASAMTGTGQTPMPPMAGSTPAGTPIPPMAGATPEATPQAQRPEPPTNLDAYLRVNEDGTVTLMTGKVEYGQGIQTGFAQLVAEELSLPFENIHVIMGQTDVAPYDIGTFGSLSTRLTGPRIRQAGAAMRLWLTELGAAQLGQDPAAVELRDGFVVVTGDPTQMVTYAELAAGQQASRELDPQIALKDPATFTVIGQSIPRPDVATKVNGEAIYGIDAAVEGMVWGKIVRPPGFGATLEAIDFSEAETAPGVVGVFQDGDFAGLAAERLEQAEAALGMVKATWRESPSTITSENIFDKLLETRDGGEKIGDDSAPADITDVLAGITEPIELTFRAPYVVHTPIEPRSALVQIGEDTVEVWSSTQAPFDVRAGVAELLGQDPASVVVYPMNAGGAFGSKIIPMAEIEATRLAQAFNRPVKLVWRRDEEFTHAQYRPAMMINIVTGLDGQGGIAGWQYELLSASYFPEGTDNPNPAAADWSADIREIYDVTASRTMWYQCQSALPPYYWRVNGATTNTWAREVTLDILAEREGVDPVTFRRNLLGQNDRMLAAMEAAVEKAGWTPQVGRSGQGIGIALGFDANTYVAAVARVEVNESTGEVLVRHVDVAIDCGLVVNPEAVKHQVEGSVVMGTSSTLREFIAFEKGTVTNPTFAQYAPITMRESPTVEVVFVEDKTNSMGGVGEPAVAPTTGAIANALYDLTGVRLFDTPFTQDRVLAAMQATPVGTPTGTPAATPVATPIATPTG